MPGDSAIFTLCDKDGNPIEGIDPITLKNGESGSWENLKWGCYTISESYPCEISITTPVNRFLNHADPYLLAAAGVCTILMHASQSKWRSTAKDCKD